jgi:hypothetical protein
MATVVWTGDRNEAATSQVRSTRLPPSLKLRRASAQAVSPARMSAVHAVSAAWIAAMWLLGRFALKRYRERDLSGPEADRVKVGDDIVVTALRRVQS